MEGRGGSRDSEEVGFGSTGGNRVEVSNGENAERNGKYPRRTRCVGRDSQAESTRLRSTVRKCPFNGQKWRGRRSGSQFEEALKVMEEGGNEEAREEFAKYWELSPKKVEVEGYLRSPLSRMKVFGANEEN
ncbi:hypothetical protein RHMOL_Rhmol06G0232900 [Rhododendron molle]|uniref:Uncharacterized protein n=1 Tax=Rhododendron molle TaxID=49168 RepID=A0ACC0NGA1_RHOML|nr:hypothetical protein RHMOL_Rhmol06G0232900 [Rhododendron molle]